ncbi:MAG TPA: type I-E CRISPR-associated protein Cas6/Cse3/CasE [Geoalkalibacter subterraneus]|uniref:Type I-E CRISPR-associated protein Cas6/Cse3/CasE n=1 Tax=Geoalkalibacter subterraneus TaxID=483547 RepID=A0A831PHU3_9BACT|nr:type I-E CRISPR-associated protein Cas6/Cse3/CasE [Geoalkalibacter subterraneus]
MYFSRIRLRRGVSPREIAKLTGMNGYKVHQLVWNLFADHPDRRRDFTYRYESVGGWPSFYTVSSREPVDAVGLWEMQAKEYSPHLRTGQRLGFSLRVNPVRTRHDANGKQQRHDVVMEEKMKRRNMGDDIDLPEIVQEQGYLWLAKRSASQGFNVSAANVRVDGYQQHRFFKGKGNKPVTFSTLDFNGVLIVSEPDVFVENTLFGGFGPAKAFGCGLMLVRKI